MSDQHTPEPVDYGEPWEMVGIYGKEVYSRNEKILIYDDSLADDDYKRRVVACVNACRKVETADLERLAELGGVAALIVFAEDYRELLADALTLLTPTNCATPEAWEDRRRLYRELPQRIREAIGSQP